MKVLFISRRFYPEIIGGGQVSGLRIAQAVRDQGHDVVVLTFYDGARRDPVKQTSHKGVRILRYPMPHLPSLPLLSSFSNLDYMYWQMAKAGCAVIARERPDIVHLLNFESVPVSAIVYKKRYGVPIVATVNGPIFSCFTQEGIDYKGRPCITCTGVNRFVSSLQMWGVVKGAFYYLYSFWFMDVLLRRSYQYVDTFFTISDAMRPLMEGMGVSSRRITTIHNPIDVRKKAQGKAQRKVQRNTQGTAQKKERTVLKKKLGIEGKRVILYAGRLASTKGVQHTIRALMYLPSDTVFVVVGQGEYRITLERIAKECDVSERVVFTGFIEHDRLGNYYSIADVVVLSCTYYEPLSRMLLEACSYGIPVIASDVGGNSEIVENGKNGILLRSLDPQDIAHAVTSILSSIINNPLMYKKMSLYAAKKMEKEFSPSLIGRTLIQEYCGLVGVGGSATKRRKQRGRRKRSERNT